MSNLTLGVTGGLYRQAPLPDDLSAVFGNPSVGVSRGQHALTRVGYRFESCNLELAVLARSRLSASPTSEG